MEYKRQFTEVPHVGRVSYTLLKGDPDVVQAVKELGLEPHKKEPVLCGLRPGELGRVAEEIGGRVPTEREYKTTRDWARENDPELFEDIEDSAEIVQTENGYKMAEFGFVEDDEMTDEISPMSPDRYYSVRVVLE